MRLVKLQDVEALLARDCQNLVLTNHGMTEDDGCMLPPLVPVINSLIVLGASPYSIVVESVKQNEIICPGGLATRVIIPADSCVGSETSFTNLFGEAWQVSSNVPLIFE